MTGHLLYLIGLPGSGKSTLAAALVAGRRRRVVKVPFAHTLYADGLVQLGRERAGHGGTDALSMSVQPAVVAALQAGCWERVFGEGDRLANAAFFDAAAASGYVVDVALVDVAPELAAARRAARGSSQSESWLRGRETRVENLRDQASIVLDGALPVSELARELAAHPVLAS